MKNNSKRLLSQKGYSIIELTVALAILAVIAAGVYSAFGGLSDDAKRQEFRRLHTDLVGGVQDYFSPSFNYTGISTQTMVDGKIVPKDMRRGTGSTASIATPYGSVTGSILEDSSRTDLWAIQYVGMPSETCAQDVASLLESSLKVEIGAAAGSLSSVKDLTATPAVQPNKATLATSCAAFSGTYTLKLTQR